MRELQPDLRRGFRNSVRRGDKKIVPRVAKTNCHNPDVKNRLESFVYSEQTSLALTRSASNPMVAVIMTVPIANARVHILIMFHFSPSLYDGEIVVPSK